MPISSNAMREGGRKARIALKAAKSGDNPGNSVLGRLKWCTWGGYRDHVTRNISEICDGCWKEKAGIK